MNDFVKFINGWTAWGCAGIVGIECYKLASVDLVPPGNTAGVFALMIVCIGLILIGLYNFVSIAE